MGRCQRAEPTLYITPMAGGAAKGYFPRWIKGDYNNKPSAGPDITKLFGGTVPSGPPIDPAPPTTTVALTYNSEFIWDVAAMNLAPGTYIAEFMVHDGDLDRALGCIPINIVAAE